MTMTPDQLAAFDRLAIDDNPSLASDLASALAGLPEPTFDEEVEEEVDTSPDPARARLAEFDNAPTEKELTQWRARYGDEGVFLVALAPEDTFLLRPLSSAEHRQILAAGAQGRSRIAPDDYLALADLEDKLKFALIKTCLLWHPEFPREITEADFVKRRAGLLNNLVTVVNINSYFFEDPQQILSFTTIVH